MLQQNYSWKVTGGDNPNAIRVDARLFNRHEGYEVQQVEKLISSELPGNVRGRKKVFDWLVGRLA